MRVSGHVLEPVYPVQPSGPWKAFPVALLKPYSKSKRESHWGFAWGMALTFLPEIQSKAVCNLIWNKMYSAFLTTSAYLKGISVSRVECVQLQMILKGYLLNHQFNTKL